MVVLRKITARVFGAAPGIGGNPLTIFAPKVADASLRIPKALEKSLAKSCTWESVFIHGVPGDRGGHRLKFFAPSGNFLSFCAHAAMGASFVIHKTRNGNSEQQDPSSPSVVSFQTIDDIHEHTAMTAHIDNEDQVLLDLQNIPFKEIYLHLMNAESLVKMVGLNMQRAVYLPINLSLLGRTKSTVEVPLEDLQAAKNPYDAKGFDNNCLFAGQTTGLFLYSRVGTDWSPEVDVLGRYECRQFPRRSGYPEDPATGIAAAAVAVYLSRRHHLTRTRPDDGVWKFRQGTVMGRPSIITVQNIQDNKENDTVSFQCGGRVEIDSEDDIHV